MTRSHQNPPYMIGQHGLKNPSETKAIARHENTLYILRISRQQLKKLFKRIKGKTVSGTQNIQIVRDFMPAVLRMD